MNERFNEFLEVWNEMRLKYQARKNKIEDYIEYKFFIPSHVQPIKIRKISEKEKLTYEKFYEY